MKKYLNMLVKEPDEKLRILNLALVICWLVVLFDIIIGAWVLGLILAGCLLTITYLYNTYNGW